MDDAVYRHQVGTGRPQIKIRYALMADSEGAKLL